jgi:plastocyanin
MKKTNLTAVLAAIMLVGTLFTFTACKKSNYSNGNNNSSTTIHMKNSTFSNMNLQVTTGTTVTWNNDDTTAHTVTANDGSFDSGTMQPGANFSHVFSSQGTFLYHDKLHNNMTGQVVVSAKLPY